jgi:hypothetical protein
MVPVALAVICLVAAWVLGGFDPVGEFSKPIPLPGVSPFIEAIISYAQKRNKASKRAPFRSLPLIHPNAAGIDVGAKGHLGSGAPLIEILSRCEPSKPLRQTFTSWQLG